MLVRQDQFVAVLLAIHHDEMIAEQRNIFRAFSKRRNVDGNHVEPVEEILTEKAFLDPFLDVHVGGRYDSQIQRDLLSAAYPGDLLVLDGTEKLGLKVQRHVADLVQKEGAGVGHLKETLLA